MKQPVSLPTTCVLVLALVTSSALFALGCSSQPLSANPSSEQVLHAALTWIQGNDTQAVTGDPSGLWWLYPKGGQVTSGYHGAVNIQGDELLLAMNLAGTGRAGLAQPQWVRIYAAAFPDAATVDRAKDLLSMAVYVLGLEPLGTLKAVSLDAKVGESQGNWIVTGKVRVLDHLKPFLTPSAFAHFAASGVAIDGSLPVTLDVDKKTGEARSVSIGAGVILTTYAWVGRISPPPSGNIISVDEYLRSVTTP